MKQFEYEKVSTPLEASEKLVTAPDDQEFRLIAGGTALVIMMKEGLSENSTGVCFARTTPTLT